MNQTFFLFFFFLPWARRSCDGSRCIPPFHCVLRWMEFFHKEEARREGRGSVGEGGRRKSRSFHGQSSLLGFPSNSSRQMEHKLRKTSAFISFRGGCNRAGCRTPVHPSFYYSSPPRFDLENFETNHASNGIGEDTLLLPRHAAANSLHPRISIFFSTFHSFESVSFYRANWIWKNLLTHWGLILTTEGKFSSLLHGIKDRDEYKNVPS